MRPQTLSQWLAALRRRGVRCRLSAEGRLRIGGLRKLTAAERDALFASSEQVRQLLAQRAQRRRVPVKQEKQQPQSMTTPEAGRRVVGMRVVAGYPELSTLLYEDETTAIRPSARSPQLAGIVPEGWRQR